MTSPHSLFLFMIFFCAGGAYVFYRVRPRAFMKTVRWFDAWSGLMIILTGLTVLLCGCLGFAAVGQERSGGTLAMSSKSDMPVADSTTSNTPSLLSEQLKPNSDNASENAKRTPRTSLAGAIYETFQIFAFNIEHTELERSALLRIAMIAAILLATMVASKGLAILFHRSYEDLGLRFKSMHIVVCGLGRIGRQLLADLEMQKSEFQIVVIEPDEDNKNIEWAREMGAVVLIGDATRTEMLEAARVHRAKEIFVVTGSDECNIESVIEIRDILARKGRKGRFGEQLPKLRCHVHVLDKDLAEIVRDKSLQLQRHPQAKAGVGSLAKQVRGSEPPQELIDIEVFNALERTARRLLEDVSATILSTSASNKSAIDSPNTTSPSVLHYFLFGFGEFGQTLALKLAELSHFPPCARARMSVFDTDIAKKAAPFLVRYPTFCAAVPPSDAWNFDSRADAWDSHHYRPVQESQLEGQTAGIEYVCNARFLEYRDIADDMMLNHMREACKVSMVQPIILVCFEDDRENFARAERLRAKLHTLDLDWPVFVWIPRQRELSQLLSEPRQGAVGASAGPCQLIPFGQCYGSVSYHEITDSWMDWLARHIHLVWMQSSDKHWTESIGVLQNALQSANCIEKLQRMDWGELDKTAKRVWEERHEWERASNRSCAVHAVLKAASLGLRITGYTTQPQPIDMVVNLNKDLDEQLREMEHYRWVAERLLTGWRYAETRSDQRKTRWQITSWSGLESPPQCAIDAAKAKGKSIDEKRKDEVIVIMLITFMRIGLLTTKPLGQKG